MKRLRTLVEWSKGSPLRYAFKGGRLVLVGEDAPAPVNYGFVPGLLNPADGEEVDACYLGPPLPPGTEAEGFLIGMVALSDGDHKLVLSPEPSPLDPEALAPLLAWFAPERKPTLIEAEAAWAWLMHLQGGEG